ncbi:MAG: hypothetical protein A3C90_02795 [Candidatus Magasanikbacteria bacterium RIFCSPHIGHO2_02_FULL_51_14]|uniref:VOC domain-containing protein n=1 Tax=Candidatus Magasanikbacteria bacterium RIFCSPHIGHO2_02_FULL_51_14 TaxID=1798683 RepID=A0A1F6MQH8_9BACT|nr:MAG: hypothetical protein A3C90_02795 [Candidatus Magasanikbacteria bacterium RIFCSPHIGHO2_02_FULL_51_14]
MPKVTLDHVYVSVANMDRAVAFYEDLLNVKAAHREGNTWADFDTGSGCYFGLISPDIIDEKRIIGNNTIPVFYADDVDAVYEAVQKHGVRIVFPPMELEYTEYRYRCFQCEDTEGNLIEIARYLK